MAELFGRVCNITIGTVQIRYPQENVHYGVGSEAMKHGFSISFRVQKTSSGKTPDSAEITVYNLLPETRAATQTADTPVVLTAGYRDTKEVVFKGKLRTSRSYKRGVNWVTIITAGDGEKELQTTKIQKTWKEGTPINVVALDVVKSAGLNTQQVAAMLAKSPPRFADRVGQYPHGIVINDHIGRAFDLIFNSVGYEWVIQDEQIIVVKRGESTGEPAVLIAPDTGLIDTPEFGEEGHLKVRSLLQPGLRPLGQVLLRSQSVNGFFRIEGVTHSGETFGQGWYSDLDLRVLRGVQ